MVAQGNQYNSAVWRYTAPPSMNAGQLATWIKLLAERTGISWPEKRKSFLLTSLSTRMRELGFVKYEDYFNYLTTGRRGAVEWEILVEYLTVHESRFYRDQHSLAMIRDEFLPALLNRTDNGPLTINAWSMGCATGEEAYSLAMLFDHYLSSKHLNAYYSITASDISAASLSAAREAVYHSNKLRQLPENFVSYYFARTDDNHFQVKQHIRDRICFTRLNLIHLARTRVGMMDLIYCQNVLIYFKRSDRNSILDQMVEHLKPGGMLVLGSGEISDWKHPQMMPVSCRGTLAFRRRTAVEERQ